MKSIWERWRVIVSAGVVLVTLGAGMWQLSAQLGSMETLIAQTNTGVVQLVGKVEAISADLSTIRERVSKLEVVDDERARKVQDFDVIWRDLSVRQRELEHYVFIKNRPEIRVPTNANPEQ